jgi:hypothetical protein
LQKRFIFLHFGAGQQCPEGVFGLKTQFFPKATPKKMSENAQVFKNFTDFF